MKETIHKMTYYGTDYDVIAVYVTNNRVIAYSANCSERESLGASGKRNSRSQFFRTDVKYTLDVIMQQSLTLLTSCIMYYY